MESEKLTAWDRVTIARNANRPTALDYIENIFTHYGINPNLVCELACGTGNVTIPLAKRGYDMTAVDISEDMYEIPAEDAYIETDENGVVIEPDGGAEDAQ